MIKAISHIGLAVTDTERSAEFFSKILSAQIVKRNTHRKGPPETFAYVAGTWFVFVATTPNEIRTDDHIAFTVPEESLDDYARTLTEDGIAHEFSPHGTNARSLYFYDYDNHLFELHTGALEQWLSDQRKQDYPGT